MNRRRYLRLTGTAVAVGAAGCLGGGNPNVTLEDQHPEVESEALAYPAWGERLPDVSFQDPLGGESVNLREVDETRFITFIFTNCQTVCPLLTSALQKVQVDSIENGYADEVRFFPVSFDPARDDGPRFREYAEQMHVSLEANNWAFLRPADEATAKEKINDEFGVGFEKQPMEDSDNYMFGHLALILLVNSEGYVERAYTEQNPDAEQLITDLKKVR
ncbi:MAG: SCO family protein [Halobacteriota archaeon]